MISEYVFPPYMSTQNSSPEATDSFELPDVLDETPDCMDFAAAFHKYRDVMDYNSRLILVLVRTERLSKETLDKLSPITQVFEYTLVCVLLTTKNGDIIHLDKKVWDNPHCNTIRAEAVYVYDALMKDNIIPNISRNFRIMHICIGYALFDIDTMAKENDLHFYLEGGTFVKECVPNFIRDQDVPDMPTYLRTAHTYYTTTFRVLMRFSHASGNDRCRRWYSRAVASGERRRRGKRQVQIHHAEGAVATYVDQAQSST